MAAITACNVMLKHKRVANWHLFKRRAATHIKLTHSKHAGTGLGSRRLLLSRLRERRLQRQQFKKQQQTASVLFTKPQRDKKRLSAIYLKTGGSLLMLFAAHNMRPEQENTALAVVMRRIRDNAAHALSGKLSAGDSGNSPML